MNGGWLVRVGRAGEPLARLICLPYAGAGTAAYRGWAGQLPPWLEVWATLLPGRESRLGEPGPADLRDLVTTLTAAIPAELTSAAQLPYALYGHSMGAVLAYELAHSLGSGPLGPPAHLFVTGRRAPHVPDELPGIHRLPWPDFLAEISRLGGVPEAILAEPGLADLVIPAVARDFAVVETYQYAPRPPLRCGISVIGGDADPTTAPEQLGGWRSHTAGPFSVRVLPGDHFFINSERDQMLTALTDDLLAALDGGG